VIGAPPFAPALLSSLIVLFSSVEILLLPLLAGTWLIHHPFAAGAWLALSVKTDGAAIASAAVAEGIAGARAAALGTVHPAGWLLATATATKVFLDLFIAFWSVLLAYLWTKLPWGHASAQTPSTGGVGLLWERFPKFILGYLFSFLLVIALGLLLGPRLSAGLKQAVGEVNLLRTLFFYLAFLSIGLQTRFSQLREEPLRRLAAVYAVSLFGFVVWLGLAISWILFHGVRIPLGS
jgi:uncharacterized membrane protein YadS